MNNALRLAAILAFAFIANVAHAADGHAAMSVGAVVLGTPCVATTASQSATSGNQCRAMVRVDHVAAGASQLANGNADVVEYVY